MLCLDRLNIARTLGSFISRSLNSSCIIIITPSSYSCGPFNSSIDSYISNSVSVFSKSLLLTISSFTRSMSFSFKRIGKYVNWYIVN